MNIVGLGKAGCSIASKMGEYPQYTVYKIDVGLEGEFDFIEGYDDAQQTSKTFSVKEQDNPEEYENNAPNLTEYFRDIKEETIFIVSGINIISGMCLRILEQLAKKTEISILYIKPDTTMLSSSRGLQENMVYKVLQEYTRSGVFKVIYLISVPEVEKMIGEISIMSYWDQIDSTIAYMLHMMNIYKHSPQIMGNEEAPKITSRIATFGVGVFGEEIKMLFSLDNIREIGYIYGVNENSLKTENKLFTEIKGQIRQRIEKDNIKVTYKICSTSYEKTYIYCTAYTPHIQT